MSYTTVSSSRRLFMVKVKGKPARRNSKPPPVIRNDKLRPIEKRVPVPVLFERHSSLPALAAPPTPWWMTWQAASLTVVLATLVFVAILIFGKNNSADERRSVRAQQTVVKASREINIHPMGFSSALHPAIGKASQLSAGLPGRNPGSRMGGDSADKTYTGSGRAEPGSMPSVDEMPLVLSDGHSKLVLPTDISGLCDIGESGIKDLSACLSRNGARFE
jgi:hypothetical protein